MTLLLAVGFLLGQRSATPVPAMTPPPIPAGPIARVAPVTQAEATPAALDVRLDALEKRVRDRQQQVGGLKLPATPTSAPPTALPAPPTALPATEGVSASTAAARRAYFERVDAIVGRAAFSSSHTFASRLLEEGLLGGQQELERLRDGTRQARQALRQVVPPSDCRKHHTLALAQLADAQALLEEVAGASATGDPQRLQSLAGRQESAPGESAELYRLDRLLRQGL